MNRHQVLTGAVNAGDNCCAVGGVDGVPFIAYAAGCNIVILSSDCQRVQVIPGVKHGNVQVSCLDCSADYGKIAASYGKKIFIFEPTPLLHQSSAHRLDYCWLQTASFETDCPIHVLSWNPDGTQVLTGGDSIQQWVLSRLPNEEEEVTFQVGRDQPPPPTVAADDKASDDDSSPKWECLWKCKTSSTVNFLKFSSDGTLFASAGKNDRLVKIWYENRRVNFSSMGGGASFGSDLSYTFVYIAHPRAVTSLSWRRTSKYMPRHSVANMLVTSCRDNICRLWLQTLLPEDGLVNMQQIEALAPHQAPHAQTQRHRHRILQRLKHMKSVSEFKRRQATQMVEDPKEIIPSLPSTFSVHDFHSFGFHGSGVAPGIHFHLAASINAATDIPLVPSISGEGSTQFVLHWLNNKETVFSQATEQLLMQLSHKSHLQQQQQQDGVQTPGSTSPSQDDSQSETSLFPSIRREGESEESTRQTISNVSSSVSMTQDHAAQTQQSQQQSSPPLVDALDRKIDSLLRDWFKRPDLLFSIHPVDGSFLVWLVEYLDEVSPGSYRQAQVSFCSRLPGAFPLGDAATMAEQLCLYSPHGGIALRTALLQDSIMLNPHGMLQPSYVGKLETPAGPACSLMGSMAAASGTSSSTSSVTTETSTPILCMISRHSNGSLNLWQLTFGDQTNYTQFLTTIRNSHQVLNVSHSTRVCGHRFRINDVTCHPVLPLLLTTSHHNVLGSPDNQKEQQQPRTEGEDDGQSLGFCSELILWKVDPVGPLSKSGGVTELARINSPEISAFSNVAWIPTLLPSTTLGSISNSTSACFVASDGQRLRIYQAVIDARTILAEVSTAARHYEQEGMSMSSSTSSPMGYRHGTLQETFRIVSLQSTARPGCILELEAIEDARHDWHNTQLLHVFQEQMLLGRRMEHPGPPGNLNDTAGSGGGLVERGLEAVVDLRRSSIFQEPFYLVVLEKTEKSQTLLHMWKVLLASHTDDDPGNQGAETASVSYVPDSNLVQESDHSNQSSRSNTPEPQSHPLQPQASPLRITTTKVCSQLLPLDEEVVHAAPCAGHLSSSSIYPACFAPYLICTACLDGSISFWHCKEQYSWVQWTMMMNDRESSIEVQGQPLCVSSAFSGRMACAYKHGRSFTRSAMDAGQEDGRFVNISISIFECESTGGSEWILEDTIPLKNVALPSPNPSCNVGQDLGSLYNASLRNRLTVEALVHQLAAPNGQESALDPQVVFQRLLSVPSYTTLNSLRKAVVERGNQSLLTPHKSLVQLDWVSTEDGSHVLTVSVGSKILLFTPVSTDIAQSNVQALKAPKSVSRVLLKQASSMGPPPTQPEEMRWMCLRTTYLSTTDGLPALPMQLSWVRDGILVVGLDSEMHIYSQWRANTSTTLPVGIDQPAKEAAEIRSLREEEILSRAQEASTLRIPSAGATSSGNISRNTSSSLISAGLVTGSERPQTDSKHRSGSHSMEGSETLPDFGLFEASRLACPVLPQYHPKQLMELLEFGKIRRVKAILGHLLRCLASLDNFQKSYEHFLEMAKEGATEGEAGGEGESRSWSRSRALSLAAAVASPGLQQPSPLGDSLQSGTLFPEEIQLDYVEITSIPPLPLFTLLASDLPDGAGSVSSSAPSKTNQDKDYSGLFDMGSSTIIDDYLDSDKPNLNTSQQSQGSAPSSLTSFGPRQVRLLSKLLTHTHLPGLSSLDQMHLLALADTVASTAQNQFAYADPGKGSNEQLQVSIDTLDECGLRFLLSMRHHSYLLCCLPLMQRAQLQRTGLSSHSLVWAFHSETQDELLQLMPSIQKGNTKWADLKEMGAGWWVRSNALLRTTLEKVAKAAFQANSDPLDAALFYLAMKKKNLVWGLFRSLKDSKMTAFFQNNFLDDRWRKAALKNAFALLGKQRFEHAAAFFLLAGSLKDAVDVCLHKLEDLQLAMVLVRLYEGELESCPPQLRRLLHQEILSGSHPDPFLRSMALWWLQDYKGALTTLLHKGKGQRPPTPRITTSEGKTPDVCNKGVQANPSVFNFYLYLRTNPLVVRSHLVQQQGLGVKGGPQHPRMAKGTFCSPTATTTAETWLSGREDTISPLERRLYFMTAHAHFQAGCPALALEVLCRLPDKIALDSTTPASWDASSPLSPGMDSPSQGDFAWNQPMANQKAESFDWGSSTTNQKQSESMDWSQPMGSQKMESFDWSQPMGGQKAESFDWSQPMVGQSNGEGWGELDPQKGKKPFDWNQTVTDEAQSSDDDDGIQIKASSPNNRTSPKDEKEETSQMSPDVMAQQLKFIACLKIMMEELSTLATGFEVDGGQLRYHLYTWLERSVASLGQLCGTAPHSGNTLYQSIAEDTEGEDTVFDGGVPEAPTLHEILAADRLDFEAKLARAARRRHWLRANETLLRTLLSYCSLHGAHGGGLAAVRMELMLLLQELQQEERSQHQLLSPLPFPTTLPLLAASVASQKTVVTDPIRFLQSCSHDILQTVEGIVAPPGVSSLSNNTVSILRDLGTALSACIYQSLCDSDNFVVKQNKVSKLEEFISSSVVHQNSHLLAGHRSHQQQIDAQEESVFPTTTPNKWPGVQSLRALLARDKDEDSPKLHTLLYESFVAVYLSQLAYALATYDCHLLYRLVKGQFKERHWSALFGGGTKRLLRVSAVTPPTSHPSTQATPPNSPLLGPNTDATDGGSSGESGLFTTLSRQRLKLHWRLLGQGGSNPLPSSSIKEDRPTYREQFLPPEMSMVSCFMAKPQLPVEWDIDYDSNASLASSEEEEEGEEEEGTEARPLQRPQSFLEQLEPGSFSWSLMRLALVKLAKGYLLSFLDVAGIELQDLPVTSPWVHSSLRVMEHWLFQLQEAVESHGRPPSNFLPNLVLQPPSHKQHQQKPALKYKTLLEIHNTPFKSHHPLAVSARRLWNYLVRQDSIQDIFIRYIFSRKHPHLQYAEEPSEPVETEACPVRIIHKDQDSILCFCLSKNGAGNEMLALSTLKEIQELDVALLMKEDTSWLEDEAEYDILNMNKSVDYLQASDYIVVQHPSDRQPGSMTGAGSNPFNSPTQPNASIPGSGSQTGRQTTVIKGYPGGINPQFYQFVLERSRHLLKPLKKHKVDGIRRMCAHPYLPLYLTGSQDGSVKMWEWGHQQPVSVPRPAGTFAKVTRVLFNTQGNKFGVTDGDGNVSLWQVGLASMSTAPFFSVQCHTKQTSDFDFVQSSSLLATAGQSSESRNVSLWDTLLPQRKAQVASFQCHENGSSAVAFAARNQVIISAGKKGDICIFDVRQRQLRHVFQAHDHPVKCLVLDPGEEFFVTGSADGDIKVWGLNYHVLLYSFPGEHARSTLFRNIGMGVSQLYVDRAGHLLSCGADGSLKWRQLPERDLVVKSLA